MASPSSRTSSSSDNARFTANLRLLQRTVSSNINDIYSTATHVVLYEFTTATSSWTKCGIEGSLFVTIEAAHAAVDPEYKLVIMNRNSTNNFILPVSGSLQCQHQDPFLIINTSKVYGIWFHNADERVSVLTRLEQTVRNVAALSARAVPTVSPTVVTPTPTINTKKTTATTDPVSTASQQQQMLSPCVVASSPPVAETAMASSSPQMTTVESIESETIAATAMMAATTLATASTTKEISSSSAPSSSATTPIRQNNAETTSNTRSQSTTSSQQQQQQQPIALDRKAMQLALLSLMQDDRFLDLLHTQYLRVIKSRQRQNTADNNQQQQQPPQPP